MNNLFIGIPSYSIVSSFSSLAFALLSPIHYLLYICPLAFSLSLGARKTALSRNQEPFFELKLRRSPSRQLGQPERVPAVSLRNVSQAGYFEDRW